MGETMDSNEDTKHSKHLKQAEIEANQMIAQLQAGGEVERAAVEESSSASDTASDVSN